MKTKWSRIAYLFILLSYVLLTNSNIKAQSLGSTTTVNNLIDITQDGGLRKETRYFFRSDGTKWIAGQNGGKILQETLSDWSGLSINAAPETLVLMVNNRIVFDNTFAARSKFSGEPMDEQIVVTHIFYNPTTRLFRGTILNQQYFGGVFKRSFTSSMTADEARYFFTDRGVPSAMQNLKYDIVNGVSYASDHPDAIENINAAMYGYGSSHEVYFDQTYGIKYKLKSRANTNLKVLFSTKAQAIGLPGPINGKTLSLGSLSMYPWESKFWTSPWPNYPQYVLPINVSAERD